MLALTRWNPFDEMLSLPREMDRLFSQFDDLFDTHAGITDISAWPNRRVTRGDDAWTVEVPIPGIDPQDVIVEAAGNSIRIRAQQPAGNGYDRSFQYSHTFSVPSFIDLDRVTATHRHGMLVLTLPLQERVRPRRIPINTAPEQKQLTAAAA